MPTVAYPGECSMCCFCEVACPEVAIDVHLPLHQMLDFGITPTSLSKKSKFLDQE
jgi:formate hydrogenlyase subunit 6/NADH:ubiquinone oxidoreductase subunit I